MSLLSFVLTQKKVSKEKVKANRNAPRVLPCQHHTFGFENNFQCTNENTLRSVHIQRFTLEVTVTQQLNQGGRKKSAVYLFFLDFFGTFCVKTKST
jgi:hypothetical protein